MAVFQHWPHLEKTNTDVIKTLLRAGNRCGKPENIGADGPRVYRSTIGNGVIKEVQLKVLFRLEDSIGFFSKNFTG